MSSWDEQKPKYTIIVSKVNSSNSNLMILILANGTKHHYQIVTFKPYIGYEKINKRIIVSNDI